MEIRRAEEKDIPGLAKLLRQVLEIHHAGRPDLFRGGVRKYTDSQLAQILSDDKRPVFAAFSDGKLAGYAFCVMKESVGDNILTDMKSLYIDDLCVDEAERGKHIGKALYDHVIAFAKKEGCYNVTLNVWTCNEGAMKFYESMNMSPQKICMETIL